MPKKDNNQGNFYFTALRVAALILLCKIVAATKEVFVAYYYGASDLVDAYQFALTISIFIPNAMVNTLVLVGVPLLVSIRNIDTIKQTLFFQEIQIRLLFVGLAISFSLFLIFPYLLTNIIKAQADSYFFRYSNEFFKVFFLFIPCILISGLGIVRLRSRQRQIDSLLEAIPSMSVLVCLLLFFQSNSSITPLAWGTALGFLLQCILIKNYSFRTDNIPVSIRLAARRQTPYWKDLYKKLAIVFFCQLLIILTQPFDQYMAVHLEGNANSILGYANRLLYFLLGVGATAAARAALPLLSESKLRISKKALYTQTTRYSFFLMLLGCIIAVIAWHLAPWGIKTVFEHGAFTPKNTLDVTRVLRWGLLQLPFYFSALLLMQLLTIEQYYRIILFSLLLGFAAKLILNNLLLKSMHMEGFMLSTSAMYFIVWIIFFITIKLRSKHPAQT